MKKKVIIGIIIAVIVLPILALAVSIIPYLYLKSLDSGHIPGYTKIGEYVYVDDRDTSIDMNNPHVLEEKKPKSPKDYELLRHLKKLEYLYTSGAVPPENLEFLRELKNIKRLGVRGAYTDISPLAELENLEMLNICVDNVTDLSPLYGLKNLKGVYLFGAENFTREQLDELAERLPAGAELTAFMGEIMYADYKMFSYHSGDIFYSYKNGAVQPFYFKKVFDDREDGDYIVMTVRNISGETLTFTPYCFARKAPVDMEFPHGIGEQEEITLKNLESAEFACPVEPVSDSKYGVPRYFCRAEITSPESFAGYYDVAGGNNN